MAVEIKICDNWMDSAEYMTQEQKIEYYGILCLHYMGQPQTPESAKDPMVKTALVSTLPLVEQYNKTAEENAERGKRGGRPSKLTKEMVHDYALQHPGCTCKEVADYFGVAHTTIAHNQGWKERDRYWF